MALGARLVKAAAPPRDEWPYHTAACAVLSTLFLRSGDRRLEAETFLSAGYGIRISIQCKQSGWAPLNATAEVTQPPRTKGILVSPEFGTPFLIAGQMFEFRPALRKWLAVEKVKHADQLYVHRGEILVRRSANVGASVMTFTPHIGALISDHFFRVRPRDVKDRGWLWAFLRAAKTRLMMTSAKYGHIIKHLEIPHLNALPVPEVPAKWRKHFDVRFEEILELREAAYKASLEADERFTNAVGRVQKSDNGENGFELKSARKLFNRSRRLDAAHYNPIATDVLRRLAKSGVTETLSQCGYKVWVPGRYKRVPADNGVTFVDSSSLFDINPELPKRFADCRFGDDFKGRVKPGWILMASSGQTYGLVGGAVLANQFYDKKVIANHVIRIVAGTEAKVRPGYALVALTHPVLGRPVIKSFAFGSSVPEIDTDDVKRFPITRLPAAEENAIADLSEKAADLRARADLLENAIAAEAEMLIDRFIAGEDLRRISVGAVTEETVVERGISITVSPSENAMTGIEKAKQVCGGDACIAGTRIPIWVLESARRQGATDSDILADYPNLRKQDLGAAWNYVKTHPDEIDRAIAENQAA
jgi:uncharacterized protein (DUF433 family)